MKSMFSMNKKEADEHLQKVTMQAAEDRLKETGRKLIEQLMGAATANEKRIEELKQSVTPTKPLLKEKQIKLLNCLANGMQYQEMNFKESIPTLKRWRSELLKIADCKTTTELIAWYRNNYS